MAALKCASLIPELVSLVEKLSAVRSIAEIVRAVTCSARSLLEADGVTFVLREGDKCHYVDEAAISPLWKGSRFPLDQCVSGQVMQRGIATSIEDIYADSHIPLRLYHSTFVRGLAVVPVGRRDAKAAVGAYWRMPHRTTAEEMSLLQAIANATALAFAHVELIKQQAEMKRAKEEAERTARIKSRFLGAASHDLRQPVQALFLYTEMLFHQNLGGRAGEAVIAMRRNLTALKELLEGVLDLTRLEAGSVRATIRDVPLDEVLAPVISVFAPLAAEKGLDWECDAAGVLVRTDPLLLSRVIRNLADNAIRYTDSGGVRIHWREKGGLVRLSVSDTGRGIPRGSQDEVFDEFHQLPGAQTGAGLGLAIVRSLCAILGHDVELESQVGRGTTFHVSMPRGHGCAVMGHGLGKVRSVDGGGRNVVLIDDDPDTLKGLGELLADHNYRAISASTGQSALDLIENRASAPDLLIVDYHLPEGRTALDEVPEFLRRFGGSFPCIIIAGSLDTQVVDWARDHHVPVLAKPVEPSELLDAIVLAVRH